MGVVEMGEDKKRKEKRDLFVTTGTSLKQRLDIEPAQSSLKKIKFYRTNI